MNIQHARKIVNSKLEILVTASNVFLACLVLAIFLLSAGIGIFEDDLFLRGIISSLFGACLSVAFSVYLIPEIIKKDQGQKGLARCKDENKTFLEYLKESRMQYIQLGSDLAKIGEKAKKIGMLKLPRKFLFLD